MVAAAAQRVARVSADYFAALMQTDAWYPVVKIAAGGELVVTYHRFLPAHVIALFAHFSALDGAASE